MRKGLLSDLSSLVKASKGLQGCLLERGAADATTFEALDEMVLKAFKVVTRAVRFLDVWEQDVASAIITFDLAASQRPLTPPTESPDAETSHKDDSSPNGDEVAAVQPSTEEQPTDSYQTVVVSPRSQALAALTSAAEPADSLTTRLDLPRPPSAATKREAVAHRLSYIRKASITKRPNIASEKLSKAHDAFLGHIGSFIGLHLQSRTSQYLLETTAHSVAACKQLLAIITDIWERDSRRSEPLQLARETMFSRLAELILATKEILLPRASNPSDDVFAPDTGRLVTAATNCVRAAGDCVARARQVIEKIGDFEFEPDAFGIPDTPAEPAQSLSLLEAPAPAPAPTPALEPAPEPEQVQEPLPELALESAPEPAPESVPELQPELESIPELQQEPVPEPEAASEPAVTESEPVDTPIADSKPLPPTPPSEGTETVNRPAPIIVPDSKPLPVLPEMSPMSPILPALPVEEPVAMDAMSLQSRRPSRPLLPALTISTDPQPMGFLAPDSAKSIDSPRSRLFRKPSVADGAMSADHSSVHGDNASFISHASTQPTTPDRSPATYQTDSTLLSSFGSVSELQSMASEDCRELEERLLEKTYAHELMCNKEGQVIGGTLPALVEKLTTHDSTPDATFVTTFYLTFRLFTTPVEFAQCLADRFEYIGDSQEVGIPVRLRVYNVFKGWLESHWQSNPDDSALGVVLGFATGPLRAALPAAGKRLAELTSRVTEVHAGALVPRLVSSLGKTSTSVLSFSALESSIPAPVVNRSQLNSLRNFRSNGTPCSILDFDPMELARQFTLIESRIFNAIQPAELIGSEWTKKNTNATNVRAMSTLSTDLANLVADSILSFEEPKKRAQIIKQWVKIAGKCLELNNYDSLMAIICSLNSSMVLRLKRTWELVSQKTLARFNELKSIVDVGKNYAVLRQRLQNHVAPCIPFVGLYLTDLTFVDVGNQTTRQLPGEGSSAGAEVINFDKHMKTARIIGQLQQFQVPYRLAAVPEMQEWMEGEIKRVRSVEGSDIQTYYRRSLLLEPREPQPAPKMPIPEPSSAASRESGKEKFDLWGIGRNSSNSANSSKEKLSP